MHGARSTVGSRDLIYYYDDDAARLREVARGGGCKWTHQSKIRARSSPCVQRPFRRMIQDHTGLHADSARRGRCLMRGSDRMHALYLHFTDAPLSDYARAENHSAALQITFIFYSAEICMISKSRNSSPDPIELSTVGCV